jgi:hypothetical protein
MESASNAITNQGKVTPYKVQAESQVSVYPSDIDSVMNDES